MIPGEADPEHLQLGQTFRDSLPGPWLLIQNTQDTRSDTYSNQGGALHMKHIKSHLIYIKCLFGMFSHFTQKPFLGDGQTGEQVL